MMMADDFDLNDVKPMDIPDVDQPPEPVVNAPVPPPAPEPPAEPSAKPSGVSSMTRKTQKALHAQKKVKIMIPSTEIDKDDVMVQVNGYCYQIKRDEEVPVPESVYQVLKDAKTKVYQQVPRGDGQEGNELVEQEVQRIPFSVVA